MDPIERLKLYMAMWEQWFYKYKTYKYHGLYIKCRGQVVFVPFYEGNIINKVPPLYYKYSYTGNETNGWFRVYYTYNGKVMLFMETSDAFFRSWGSNQKFDTINIDIVNPKTKGSVLFKVSLYNPSCGVYNNNIPTYNKCVYSYRLDTPLWYVVGLYGKWGYYTVPPGLDWWFWEHEPSFWDLTYIFNWRYNSITNTYDIWDNKNQKKFNLSVTSFHIQVRSTYDLTQSMYPGSCFRQLGAKVSDIAAYSDVWFPPP